jgi:hypothetical protein
MPFRRRRYRRRFRRRFNAKRAIARMYRALKPETKYFTWNLLPAGNVIGPLSGTNQSPYRFDITKAIVQGPQNNQRIGRHVKIKSVIAKLWVNGPVAGNEHANFRTYFCREEDTDPIAGGGTNLVDPNVPIDYNNMNFHERRWFPRDKMLSVTRSDAGAYSKPLILSYKFKKGGMNVSYPDGSGNLDAIKNQLTFNAVSSTDSLTLDNNIRITGTIRVYYTDC